YQLDPAVAEFRDRLIEWQNKPSRARRIFQGDLERWRFENSDTERALLAQQDAWVAQQHHEQHAGTQGTLTPEPAFRSEASAPSIAPAAEESTDTAPTQ